MESYLNEGQRACVVTSYEKYRPEDDRGIRVTGMTQI